MQAQNKQTIFRRKNLSTQIKDKIKIGQLGTTETQ